MTTIRGHSRRAILACIASAPRTVRESAAAIGGTRARAAWLLARLRDSGMAVCDGACPATWTATDAGRAALKVPEMNRAQQIRDLQERVARLEISLQRAADTADAEVEGKE